MAATDLVILADVVDNYGDIGVSWRLCRHLLAQPNGLNKSDSINIRLVTNNLNAFHNINNQIDPNVACQKCPCENGFVEVYDWTNYDFCYKYFTENPPEIILEMFQCGQPDWLEKILFEDRVDGIVNIIMIDYLSAEPWVDDFHCLKSLTRTALVPKVNFMPGFTKKTGGLLLTSLYGCKVPKDSLIPVNNNCESCSIHSSLLFAYPSDWSPVIRAMNRCFKKDTVLKIAGGAGQESILKACLQERPAFNTEALSYMNQMDWDKMMSSMDFMIIRGEDSMAQACCMGIPFIWQAYPQNENYHMVKVEALLNRMQPFFGNEFIFVEKAWKAINSLNVENSPSFHTQLEEAVYDFLKNIENLKNGFSSFALSLRENGDLAHNLMTFINKSIKMDNK